MYSSYKISKFMYNVLGPVYSILQLLGETECHILMYVTQIHIRHSFQHVSRLYKSVQQNTTFSYVGIVSGIVDISLFYSTFTHMHTYIHASFVRSFIPNYNSTYNNFVLHSMVKEREERMPVG